MSLIEKIARVLLASESAGQLSWDDVTLTDRAAYKPDAQAALTAIMGEGDGVQQCDRRAAADLVGFHARQEGIDREILLGGRDDHPLAQAFARHRSTAAAAERARRDAEIVAWLRDQDKSTDVRDAADAIERGEV